jgi:hypothetical protein
MEIGESYYLGLVAKSEGDVATKDPFKDQHVDNALAQIRFYALRCREWIGTHKKAP